MAGERTEFSFPDGCGAYDHYCESTYTLRPVGAVGSDGHGAAKRPLTVKYPDGRYAAVTEVGNED